MIFCETVKSQYNTIKNSDNNIHSSYNSLLELKSKIDKLVSYEELIMSDIKAISDTDKDNKSQLKNIYDQINATLKNKNDLVNALENNKDIPLS